MPIESLLGLVVYLVAALSLAAFGIGFMFGKCRTQSRTPAYGILALTAVLTSALVVGTLPLARRIGPFITLCAVLFAGAITNGLLGGYVAGRRKLGGQSVWSRSTFTTFLIIALFLGYAHTRIREVGKTASEILPTATKYEPETNKDCPENLKSLYLAFASYAQDWDALPPADNWLDNEEIVSKVTKNEWLHCPAISNRQDDKFGYAFNAELSARPMNGKPLKEMPNAATTPLLYDSTNLAKNAQDKTTSLPRPGRHSGRNNILYCDGHVAAVEPR
jgi:prepilin-type processing-associated H-X9-DG protein